MLQKLRTRFSAILRYLAWAVAEVLVALLITFSSGRWIIRYAYIERGYHAIGGEYFLIILIAFVSHKGIHIIFCFWRRSNARSGKKRGSSRTSWV